jgi:hypothetical protein
VERINAAWLTLATRHRLIAGGRQLTGDGGVFLLSIRGGGERQWLRVRLVEPWDLAGLGAASGVLGSGAGRPDFAMLALQGWVAIRATTGEDGVELWALPYPNAELYRVDLGNATTILEIARATQLSPTMLGIHAEVAVFDKLREIDPAVAAGDLALINEIVEELIVSRSQSIFQFRSADTALVEAHRSFVEWLTAVVTAAGIRDPETHVREWIQDLLATADEAFDM